MRAIAVSRLYCYIQLILCGKFLCLGEGTREGGREGGEVGN